MLDELQAARIKTLQVALRAALVIMREWINRVELVDGKPMVNIEDVEGAKQLYRQMQRAYAGSSGDGQR